VPISFVPSLSTGMMCNAVTSKPFIPWRLDDCDPGKILHCNITKKDEIERIFEEHQNTYDIRSGSIRRYSKQSDVDLIYETNLMGLLNLLELSSKFSIRAFVHAGSSSEYG